MQNNKTISKAIYEQLNKAQNILIVSHQGPDGDTLGSNLALTDYLLKQNKQVTSFCLDEASPAFNFLPYINRLTTDHTVFTKQYDTVIILDSSNLDYAGVENLITAISSKFTLINIDHHVSNTQYGDLNLVLDHASSTGEIIYRMFKDWQVEIDSNIATCLACGIITDTGGFLNPATSYQSLTIAADLKNKGANIYKIIQTTLKRTNVDNLKLWGRALERLTKIKKYNLVYTYITSEDFQECNVEESAVEGMTNFLHILEEGEIIMVLRQRKEGLIKASLRTTGTTDLSKLAKLFGGGGHQKAAGFSLNGQLVVQDNKLRVV